MVTLGRRLRHARRGRGLTLARLAEQVGTAASALSLIENGRREPKLTLLHALAEALGTPMDELLRAEAPSRRASLEIALERAQRDPSFAGLGLSPLRASPRIPSDVLEHVVAMHDELRRRDERFAATPEAARRANVALRRQMREQDNYFPHVERVADEALRAVGHSTGALPQRAITDLATHYGFTLHPVADLPESTRSVTDMVHRRIYLPQRPAGHDPRYVVLQTLGHFALGHTDPKDFADFLSQRVEANYFAAALLVPEPAAVRFLLAAKRDRVLSMEDLRDVFAVSHETAAHRFTNLATHHLDISVHFSRTDASGTIYKAYENDGLPFPTDAIGAIEGQPACRQYTSRRVFGSADRYGTYTQYTDTPAGTFFCTAHVEPGGGGEFAVTVGVPFQHARWFRGADSQRRRKSGCPAPACCRRPPAELATKWEGQAWPSARAHSHLLAALPPGTFPGVDTTDVYAFLERHAPQQT
ncbi:MAG: family transcriptional regulator, fatty acid utilization regulator [Frankiaceae bacterium]|nr:family transcriptional regulator, fatty acid utilization regulator [Frankiaceae bacterium]